MRFWFISLGLAAMAETRPKVIKLFSAQLSMKFITLINVKMPTIVGILMFIGRIISTSESFKQKKLFNF